MTLSGQSRVAPIGAILARHVLPALQHTQKLPLRIMSAIAAASERVAGTGLSPSGPRARRVFLMLKI